MSLLEWVTINDIDLKLQTFIYYPSKLRCQQTQHKMSTQFKKVWICYPLRLYPLPFGCHMIQASRFSVVAEWIGVVRLIYRSIHNVLMEKIIIRQFGY